jgi:hypothetical protein
MAKKKIDSAQLYVPHTFPDDGFAYPTVTVVEDMNHECKMHVDFADVLDYPESWGAYLAQVAQVIARDRLEYFDRGKNNTTEDEVFREICAGFNRCAEQLRSEQGKQAAE